MTDQGKVAADYYVAQGLLQPDVVRHGCQVVEALPQLRGRPWDDRALQVARAARPSCIRVVRADGEQTTDWRPWRVTVYLSAGPTEVIDRVEQEAEVGLVDAWRSYDDVADYLEGR